jgi:hypothetical protein
VICGSASTGSADLGGGQHAVTAPFVRGDDLAVLNLFISQPNGFGEGV